MEGITITGLGKALPADCVPNERLKQYMETDDAWIRERTGIETRYHSSDDEMHWKLCADAARQALDQAGISPEEIGLCIVATITPDYATPSAACLVAKDLGLTHDIPAFDINVACTGFIYGLQIASAMLNTVCDRPYALVIGAEQLSRILNVYDRGTGILFGDGAAAAIVKRSSAHRFFCKLYSEGDPEALWVPGARREDPFIHMDGHKIFRFAVKVLDEGLTEMEQESGVSADEIDWILCHQANARIIDHVRKKRKLPEEKFYMNVNRYGNTSGASVPLVLADMAAEGKLAKGTRVFLLGFGAGLAWGSAYLEF